MANDKRWFSTGWQGGGSVGGVDAEKHVLRDAVVIRPGEALTHGLWVDREFGGQVVAAAGSGKFATSGIKARFGHPNMCSDALGTFLGRWKNLRQREDGFVIGDLYLSSTASDSPRGDLRKYIEEMAAQEPGHFGASIVFARDGEAEQLFMEANSNETDGFKSPDPANGANLPHARLSELHAADLVDEPAATDGMFSGAAGAALAAQVTEWLDLHPEVLKALTEEPVMADIVARYPDEIKPFLARYAAHATPVVADAEPDAKTSAMAAEIASRKEEIASLQTIQQASEAERDTLRANVDQLTGQLAGAQESVKALEGERDTLKAQIGQLEAARDAALARVAAVERGEHPLSGASAPKDALTPWQKAQLAAKK